jgi:hypothetical protein
VDQRIVVHESFCGRVEHWVRGLLCRKSSLDSRNTGSEDCSAGSGLWTGRSLGQRIVVQEAVCGRGKTGSEDCSADSSLWTGGTLGQRIVVQVAVCGTGGLLVRGL